MSSNLITADNGVSSGVTGITQSAGSDGTLQLRTTTSGGSAVTALTIDNSQNVGIGVTPTYKLDVQTSGSSGVARVKNTLSTGYSTYAAFNDLGANMSVGMGGSASSLFSGSAFIDTGGSIPLVFATNDTPRMTLGTTGNLTFNTSNAGIVFNNSSATTNSTLNDYETGTWTPTVGGTSTSSITSAKYTKVGNMVTVSFDYTVTTIGTGSTSQIFGLPFNAGSVNTSGSISYYAGMSASVNFFTFYASGTTCVLCYNATAASTIQNNANPILTNGSRIIGSVTYQATF